MRPLADQLRPVSFEEVYGQDHLVGKEGFLTRLVQGGRPLSLIFWGPPGCGKTTLARLYAKAFSHHFVALSAVFSGIGDLRKIIQQIEEEPLLRRGTLLFVDEIHRFNKAQQDAFLPYVERGSIVLVGATTENPSFALNNALLSRVRVVSVNALGEEALEQILCRYEERERPLKLEPEARRFLVGASAGDGRYLLNLVEGIVQSTKEGLLTIDEVKELLQTRAALYDRSGEGHYNLISALHKSVRGSDPDAALYWFARILEGGEPPLYLARRLIRMAVEDIGLADPEALKLAISAKEAYQMLGSPEGELALAQLVIYLALAPKSNATYRAYGAAREQAAATGSLSPPDTILNAPTKLMKEIGRGKGYAYDHDSPLGFSGQNYFPKGMERLELYHPVLRGFERKMHERLAYFTDLRKKLTSDGSEEIWPNEGS